MNNQLQKFARETLKDGLSQLSENQQLLFKKMYSPNNLDLNIFKIVDNMSEEKLDWAIQQVERTLEKI
jgi:hypothetical protein